MRVFLIRHGESENNANRLFTGWFDAHLTEKGRNDAASVRGFLSKFKFDKVYSSDLSRAYETATIAIPDCTPEKTQLIRELCIGTLENQPITMASKESTLYHDYTSYGGENLEMLQSRVEKFTKSLEDSDFDNVAVFTHGGVLLAMLTNVLGEFRNHAVHRPNCTIAVFDYCNDKWMLSGLINPALLNQSNTTVSGENDKF